MIANSAGHAALPTTEKTADSAVFSPVITQSAVPATTAVSNTDSLIQVSGALGGIILLILALTWLVRKLGFSAKLAGKAALLTVKSSCSLGNKERLVVVEIQDEWLILGVTAQSVNLLHRCPADPDAVTNTPSAFHALLKTKRVAPVDKPI